MTNEAFEEVVVQYEKLVFTICYQFVKDYHEAQNLAQETFLSAYLHLDTCREETIKPWLARIAANKAKDYLKSAYSRRVKLGREEDLDYAQNMFLPDGAPDEVYINQEGTQEIVTVIQSLKEPYLKASQLYFLEEKTVDEIALILNRPKKTVQTQLHRARGLLQKMLDCKG